MKEKIAVVIVTYNRVDDACINMEIVRNHWAPFFEDIKIVHAYNGDEKWYPEKHLEDDLIRIENRGHFQGAVDLIETGTKHVLDNYKEYTYAVVLSSDTWCVKPEYIRDVVAKMKSNNLFLATAAWGSNKNNNIWEVGMALDFMIVNVPWAFEHELLPMRYEEFVEKYEPVVLYGYRSSVFPDRLFSVRFRQAIKKYAGDEFIDNQQRQIAESHLYRMTEREPVHSKSLFRKGRRMYFRKIGLVTHHYPQPKKKLLQKLGITNGKYIRNLLQAESLEYYNQGHTRSRYSKGVKGVESMD